MSDELVKMDVLPYTAELVDSLVERINASSYKGMLKRFMPTFDFDQPLTKEGFVAACVRYVYDNVLEDVFECDEVLEELEEMRLEGGEVFGEESGEQYEVYDRMTKKLVQVISKEELREWMEKPNLMEGNGPLSDYEIRLRPVDNTTKEDV